MPYLQHSFNLNYPETNEARIQQVQSHPFAREGKLLSLKNQAGALKLYGLVDASKPKVHEHILVVGTGQSVPEEVIDRLVLIDSILLADGKFGYSVYYVLPEGSDDSGLQGTTIYKTIRVALEHGDSDIENFFVDIQDLSEQFHESIRSNADGAEENCSDLIIEIIDSDFLKSSDYRLLIGLLHTSPVVKEVK